MLRRKTGRGSEGEWGEKRRKESVIHAYMCMCVSICVYMYMCKYIILDSLGGVQQRGVAINFF